MVLECGSHTHGANALHIAVASQWQQASAWGANHAAQQREIADGLDIFHPMSVMSNAHTPAEYGVA